MINVSKENYNPSLTLSNYPGKELIKWQAIFKEFTMCNLFYLLLNYPYELDYLFLNG